MTRYAKRKLKYSLNENFNLLPCIEWDRFVTLTGAQAEWGLRYRIYFWLDTTRAQTYNLPHLLDILNESSVILPILNIIIVIDETVLLWCWFFIYSNTEIYEKNILKFALPKHTCKNRTRKFWKNPQNNWHQDVQQRALKDYIILVYLITLYIKLLCIYKL